MGPVAIERLRLTTVHGCVRNQLTPLLDSSTCLGHAERHRCDTLTGRAGRYAEVRIRQVTGPIPYFHFRGTAREALTFYGEVFGCPVQLHTFEQFNRTDGPAEAIAHGHLVDGPVRLFASDVVRVEPSFRCEGMMLSLLGTPPSSDLKLWFARLSEGGHVVYDLQARPWGASDGQVIDRYGLHWLIGFEGDQAE